MEYMLEYILAMITTKTLSKYSYFKFLGWLKRAPRVEHAVFANTAKGILVFK